MSISTVLVRSNVLTFDLVRVLGIEPSAQPWEGYILTTIRYPLMEPPIGFEPMTPALRKRCSSQLS